ncbi:MAG: phosphatidylserine decarboxylase [Lysobacterales bacterium]|nr:MAG: phosphatidylserine decarboxylase [Xanthomonadales bacterium]
MGAVRALVEVQWPIPLQFHRFTVGGPENMAQERARSAGRIWGYAFFVLGLLILGSLGVLLRFTQVTDYLYHGLVKDPEREIPDGRVIVSPADGRVLYVTKIHDGIIPQVIKTGVPVAIVDHLKGEPLRPFKDGYLIGIYMNTQGVHINRMPNNGIVEKQTIFNGPHMDMTDAEVKIILTQMIPGKVTLRKMLGMAPYDIEDEADYVLKSARETLAVKDERGAYLYIVRIADYYVGKILTWVAEGESVARGQKLGMITWGSQTDLFIEDTPGMAVTVDVGDYVYAGETVVATY